MFSFRGAGPIIEYVTVTNTMVTVVRTVAVRKSYCSVVIIFIVLSIKSFAITRYIIIITIKAVSQIAAICTIALVKGSFTKLLTLDLKAKVT